jgi:hypothetical protein
MQTMIVKRPFQQWGLDVIGEINPNSSQLHKYILTSIDYFSIWSEAIHLKYINENQVTSFLESHIITRFEVPKSSFFDNAILFSSMKLTEFSLEINIKVKYSRIITHKGMDWLNQLIKIPLTFSRILSTTIK